MFAKTLALAALLLALAASPLRAAEDSPVVRMDTSLGTVLLVLDAKAAPATVANFLAYVDQGFFNGAIFHRVIPGFMVQGGGYEQSMARKNTLPPIKLETAAGLENKRGTLAMARTNDPDSATSQFFINLVDNAFLNPGPGNPGYAVFGKVLRGMEVVDAMAKVKTEIRGGMKDVPSVPVVITRMARHTDQ
ncbi:MAG: peptidylprolyl isomerase [Thermodesulfobacteriota bacterium]